MARGAYVSRLADLIRFYGLLDKWEARVGGRRTLNSLSSHRDWPRRGLYFFYDPKEPRKESGRGARIVRVGTHALTAESKSTLRARLGQHRGNLSGGGNHRSSIFRLLVGQALLGSGALTLCVSWGVKRDKRRAAATLQLDRHAMDVAEQPIEMAVSDYLNSLQFSWLGVEDGSSPGSFRGLVERNSIALLSNHERKALDSPSSGWLGHKSDRELVRESGLWNQRHTDEVHDPEFLDILEELIQKAGNNYRPVLRV